MNTRDQIRSVIDRVLWTAGATAHDKDVLAEAIAAELGAKSRPAPGMCSACCDIDADECQATPGTTKCNLRVWIDGRGATSLEAPAK